MSMLLGISRKSVGSRACRYDAQAVGQNNMYHGLPLKLFWHAGALPTPSTPLTALDAPTTGTPAAADEVGSTELATDAFYGGEDLAAGYDEEEEHEERSWKRINRL